ncbi:hypothetical protein [Actinomyces gaoshouyii]|uniref:hypothetical protein n=1 Tax=Actinomyces gaoshouyii TaxID=1960083 RepID=UPI0009C145E4|nr:hypothetical protein [Actinomyces gaoshouyii]ARD42495.1 hypothetical protein B6G06_09205 [Actinomyces gaoshouyii]
MTTDTLTQALGDLAAAVEALKTQLTAARSDAAPAPVPEGRSWPAEDVILITALAPGAVDVPLPAYAVRTGADSYQLVDGNVLWQEDGAITSWEPLYRRSDLLRFHTLADLPAGAQVRDRDGRAWTQMTVAWQATDTLDQLDDQELMLNRGPLTLVHDPRAQQ